MQEKRELLLEYNDFTNPCCSWVSSIPTITETFDFRRQYSDVQRLPLHWNIIPALKSTNCWIPQRWANCWVVEVGEPDVCHHWQRQLWSRAIYFLSYIPSGEPLPRWSKAKEGKKEKLFQNKPSRSNPNKYGGKGGEGKESTQFLPSLWAIPCSPKGQDLIRTVISVQICRCYENC